MQNNIKKLKTLEESDEQARLGYVVAKENTPILNGIECPECKSELYDSRPGASLMSYPPKLNVHCSNPDCKYQGYRIQNRL